MERNDMEEDKGAGVRNLKTAQWNLSQSPPSVAFAPSTSLQETEGCSNKKREHRGEVDSCCFVPPSCPLREGVSRRGVNNSDTRRQAGCSKLGLFGKGKVLYALHPLREEEAAALAPGRPLW